MSLSLVSIIILCWVDLHGDAETHNLAAERPEILKEMLELYSQYAASAVIPLTFRYGFADPESGERSRVLVLQQVTTGKARTIVKSEEQQHESKLNVTFPRQAPDGKRGEERRHSGII